MIGFQDKGGILHADDVPLPELADRYGTPLYIYSAARMRANVERLRTALTGALPPDRMPLIAFACKTNGNLAVLRLLSRLGLGCDVVSGGELRRAVRAGMKAESIVYSGVGKTDPEIMAALDAGILQINVESAAEMERIAVLAEESGRTARIAFRFNPDVAAGTHDKISTGRKDDKFGLSGGEVLDLYRQAAAHPHLAPQGLHIHIGSQLTRTEPFRTAFERLAALAGAVRAEGLPLETLDLGGGLGIIYENEQPPDLAGYAGAIRDVILPLGTRIILEPGRFIAGDAGILLTRVIAIKKTPARAFVILDAGMNDLIRPALYGARHPVRLVAARQGAEDGIYDVVGPVCETSDVFLKDCPLPSPRRGDLAAIMAAGAYGFVMASTYNTRPLPAEALVNAGWHALIRPRQDVEELLDQDVILPDSFSEKV